jgi:hypothetical protein
MVTKMKTLPKPWKLLSITILLIGVNGNACFGETQPPPPPAKADILGFYPGMKEAEFSAALRANNLSCEGGWDTRRA